MQTNTDRMEGAGGTFTINDTSVHTIDFNSIQVNEDTVFAVLELNTVNDLANSISTPANAVKPTVKTCKYGKHWTKVQLTSGSIEIGLLAPLK